MAKIANLGALNFEVILDDAKFTAQIQKAKTAANDLNVSLSALLNMQKQVNKNGSNTKGMKDWQKAMTQLTNAINKNRVALQGNIAEVNRYKAATRGMTGINMDGSGLSKQGGLMGQLTSMAMKYVSIWGATSFVKSVAAITGEFELQRMTLRAMLDDANAADQVYNRIWDLALKSPFNAKELVTYAKQLVAYSIPLNELYDTTKMLADVSSGLGVGMDRLVLAFGQIRSAAFLRGQEVRQLTESGIPILEELRKQFVELGEETITVGDVFDKISKRLVPFEMVQKVFKNMTSEGGKFFNMQEKQAETLKGKIMILKDAYDKMLNSIGTDNSSSLKGAIDSITRLMQNYHKLLNVLKSVIVGYGVYKVAMIAITTITRAQMALNYVQYLVALTARMNALGHSTNILSVAFSKLGVTAKTLMPIVGIITAITTAIVLASKESQRLNNELREISNVKFNEAATSADEFDKLYDRLHSVTEGSQNFRNAISELNNKYGEYLPNLLNENNAIKELDANYRKVTTAIYARAKAYAESEGMRKIESEYGVEQARQIQQVVTSLTSYKSLGIAEDAAHAFVKRFLEEVSKDNGTSSWAEIFSKVYSDFFQNKLNPLIDEVPNDYAGAMQMLNDACSGLMDTTLAMTKAQDKFNKTLDDRFSKVVYKSEREMLSVMKIEEEYQRNLDEINNKKLSATDVENLALDAKKIRLKQLISLYQRLDDEAQRVSGKGGTFADELNKYLAEYKALEKPDLNWLQSIVNPMATGANRDLQAKQEDSLAEYLDNLRKEYKAVVQSYDDADKVYKKLIATQKQGDAEYEKQLKEAKELYEQEKLRKELIEAIGARLGDSDDDKLTGQDKQIPDQLAKTIATLKDIYKWYNKLSELVGDVQAKNILSFMYPEQKDIIALGNFKEELLNLADALEIYGEKEAQALRDDVSVSKLQLLYDSLKDAIDGTEKLKKLLDDFNGKVELDGVGIKFDVSKAIKKYKDDIKKIQGDVSEIWKQLQDKSLVNVDASKIFNYDEFVKNIGIGQNNALTQLKDTIDNLAGAWVKDWTTIQGIEIENWGDLTYNELMKVKEGLMTLFDENGNIVDENALNDIKAMFVDMPELLDTFLNSLRKFARGDGDKIGGIFKKLEDYTKEEKIETIKYYSEAILGLADSFQKLGEASDNDSLKNIGNMMSDISKFGSSIYSGAKAGGEYGAIAAFFVTYTEKIIETATAIEESVTKINEARREMQSENFANSFDFTSIFGTDDIAGMNKAFNDLKGLSQKYMNLLDDIEGYSIRTHKVTFWERAGALWSDTKLSDSYRNIKTILESYNTDFSNPQSIIDGLNTILKSYDDLTKGEKDFINQSIADLEDYKVALEAVEKVASSLVGSMADSYVDKMIEKWYELGDATIDYADILNEVTEAYVRMWIKSSLLEKIFNEEAKDKVMKALETGDVKTFNETIDAILQSAGYLMEEYNNVLAQSNLQSSGQSSSLSISKQGITEDTGNLIAAYMNGMRTDLSAQRAVVEGIGVDMKTLIARIPTIDDNVAKIQTNTANAVFELQTIVRNLESVIGDGASSFVRVQ